MDPTAIDWLTQAALDALDCGRSLPPAALLLLLREHAAGGRSEIAEALGPALARGLEDCRSPAEADRRSDWLILFAEAAALSEDERLRTSAAALAADLARLWPSDESIARIMRSIDACLSAVEVVPDRNQAQRLLNEAVDELERVAGGAYVPGEGMRSLEGRRSAAGTLADHTASASALVTAYATTARLPYSMLAEELVQVIKRRWWDAEQTLLVEPRQPSTCDPLLPRAPAPRGLLVLHEFLVNCAAARTLSRIAALHRDGAYQQAAVVARDSDYAGDACQILSSLSAYYRAFDLDAAMYGIALRECGR